MFLLQTKAHNHLRRWYRQRLPTLYRPGSLDSATHPYGLLAAVAQAAHQGTELVKAWRSGTGRCGLWTDQ